VTESLVNQLFKDHTVYTPTYKFRFCILGVKIGAKSVNFCDLKVTESLVNQLFKDHTVYIEISILHTRGNLGKKCQFI
jgi:hypothetical protein